MRTFRCALLTAAAVLISVTPTAAVYSVTAETLRQLTAAFNRRDLQAIMTFFTDDCVMETPRGPEPWGLRYQGKAEVRKALASRLEGLADFRFNDDRHWVAGERGVSEWMLTGTLRDGAKIRLRGCELFEFRNGKIARVDSYLKIVEPGG